MQSPKDSNRISSGCACCSFNRRQFLAGCAACAAGGVTALGPAVARATSGTAGKPKVRLVFSHTPSDGPIWPNIGYDFDKRKKELTERLTASCPGLEIVPTTVMSPDEANKLLADGAGVDGYLVYLVGLWTGAPRVIAASGRPTLLVDDLFGGSGEFLIQNAASLRAGRQTVAGVSSADMNDVIAAARCFELLKQSGKTPADFTAAVHAAWEKNVKRGDMSVKEDKLTIADPAAVVEKLKKSTILVIGSKNDGLIKAIGEVFGTKVLPVDFPELHAAWEKADRDESAAWADKWMKAADKTIAVTRDEVIRSGAMYLAEKELIKKYVHADHPVFDRPAGLHFRPGHRHLQEPDHLRSLRSAHEDVRVGRIVERVRDSHPFRRPQRRGGSLTDAAGLYDHDRGVQPRSQGSPGAPGQDS
jgi:hypothetical protein